MSYDGVPPVSVHTSPRHTRHMSIPFPSARIVAFAIALMACSAGTHATAAGPLHEDIDRLIEARADGPLAPLTSDAEFLRRITLDLAGRVPTVEETRAFHAEKAADKRTRLIDRLLASPDFPRRMREWFEVMVLERRAEKSIKPSDWSVWVEKSFRENRPWNELVAKLIFVEKDDTANLPATKFLKATGRGNNAHQITQDIARIFLGQDIMCAQCHDHPSVEAYTQADYFGLFSYVQEQPAKATSEFESVFEPGKKTTGPRLPGGQEVEIPKFEKGQEAEAARYRPRLLMARDLPAATNSPFVRTSVNRLWALVIGRGLVHPPHLDHPANPPSHPKLFDRLQQEFLSRTFDTRHLLREILLSRTYQRSSRLPAATPANAPIREDRFRVALPRPLSPEQLAWSLMVATGNHKRMLVAKAPEDEPFDAYNYINGRVERLPATIGETMELFSWMVGNPPGEDPDDFNPAMGHALFLMNERLVLDWLKPRDNSLMGRVVAIPDDATAVSEIYLQVLARPPTDPESASAVGFLKKHATARTDALADLAWSLLASAEFRLNH
mgnify:CR=1 FL=1